MSVSHPSKHSLYYSQACAGLHKAAEEGQRCLREGVVLKVKSVELVAGTQGCAKFLGTGIREVVFTKTINGKTEKQEQPDYRRSLSMIILSSLM